VQASEEEIKQLIIDTLHLEDVTAADIDPAAPLFNEGLGLDSIDALELGVALQKKYGVKINAESEEIKKNFASVRSLAAFVSSKQGA
jgi:acyl carrier protein